ncbi:MAG: Ribose-phosphate pyrophosphokinase [Anaerolineae bacterium]|nr:MAG: ribose-phosphate pyrophosphokinase [Chloroflexi bacterium OLB13]MBV6436209.1 Ribose-phosphate pyrophosphokinase [Anaerolineae bacterium]GIK28952.1 MAG: ribose-phosphate pyrophosphokinase [Chloroflexota bacterium]
MKVPGTKYDPERDMTRDSKYRTPFGDLKVFFGSSAQHLKASICSHAGVPAGKYERRTFSNENIFIRLNESVRGQDVYIVQSMSSPVHDNFMELLIMIDAVMRDSAGRVNVVIPYLTYGRSDKKDQPRVPITARLVANMIETAGADRYITVDLHAGQIQGFFNIPGDAIRAFYLLSDYVRDKRIPDLTIVSADLGYAKPARNWGEALEAPVALVEKRRVDNAERPEVMSIIGSVEGRNVLLVDDEVNTGGSIVNAVNICREYGARDVYLAFTHGFLTKLTYERLSSLDVKEIILTDTIDQPAEKRLPNMTVLSVGPLLAEVMMRAHEGRSVGELFNE